MNACVRVVVLALASSLSLSAIAQEKADKRDDLDVTMQIIVDPNAKQPDEVIRRIPLPTASRAAAPASSSSSPTDAKDAKEGKKADDRNPPDKAAESRELGNEAADNARERAKDAQQQREEARNAQAVERGKDRERDPPDRPNPPNPPPRN